MSIGSDRVKQWRKNVKQRAINSMGGKCQICGYNKCNDAMDFHHIDPSKKEFTFGNVTANPKNQEIIAVELEKCILLCSNCHREFHSGIISIPSDYEKFNYDIFTSVKEKSMDSCPICGNSKPIKMKTCSTICGAKVRYKINWDEIDLIDLKINQNLPNTVIGDIIGVSDNCVKKRLKKLGII